LTSWATAYAYTAEGDLVHRDDSASGATSFEVDVAHRLVAEIDRHGNRRQYWHDAAGNVRLAWMEIGAGNRLVRAADERFSYDERHRLSVRTRADGSSIRYAYDSFDLLTRVERSGPEGSPESGPAGDDAWSASYDAIGRRIRAGTVGRKRDFYWDGDRLAAEVGPEGRLRIYDYATPAALVPLGFVEYETAAAPPGDGATYHVFSDPSGMPLRIEDEEGSVVWRAERISPFGGVDVRPGATLEYNLRWPGHYHDPETGLHYNRYRYYDPKLARYLQGDPTGYAGSPVNLYAYCANPLVHVDIRGLHDDLPKKGSSDEEDGEPDGRESPPQPSKEDLAASTENTPETRAARDALARDFYRTHCPGMSEAEIDSHVRCIDMDHPVKVVTIPPGGDGANGDQLYSWVAPGQGRPGQYFANDPATQPDALGANPRVIAPASGDTPQRVTPREQRTYAADPNQPATGLQSVAAPANDTWSVSGGSYSPESGDVPYQAPGGGTQVMVPRSQQGGFSQVDDD
jgi:RHS repeat-associated protein